MSAVRSLTPIHPPLPLTAPSVTEASNTQNPSWDFESSSFETGSRPSASPTQRPVDGLTPPSATVAPLAPTRVDATKALVETITKVSSGLELDYFGSEAGDSLSPVHIASKTEQLRSFADFKKAVTEAGVEKFGLTADMLSSVGKFESAGDNFFPWIEEFYADSPDDLARAKELVSILDTELTDTKVIIVGEEFTIEGAVHPVFIVGRAPDGSLVGVRSSVVWT